MGKKSNLGRALVKDRFKSGRKNRGSSYLHTTELEDGCDWNRLNLKSVTEQNTLDEFLSKAVLAGTEFTAEKLNISIVTNFSGVPTAEEERRTREAQDAHRSQLKIPRRPAWDESTSPEELDRLEREAFLEWRRCLSQLQEVEGIVMTPYERNLDFWRQLWRVIERSDVIMQIVDARNPLLFRCEDLETYVHEVDSEKVNMILLNKSDYLTLEQRVLWAKFFDIVNVRVAFWSAVEEANRLKQEKLSDADIVDDNDADSEDDGENASDEEDGKSDSVSSTNSEDTVNDARERSDIDDDDEWEDLDEEVVSDVDEIKVAIVASKSLPSTSKSCGRNDGPVMNSPDLLTGPQLIKLLRSLNERRSKSGDDEDDDDDHVTTIGLVGYPNVGKSSTINTLLQTKKVPVSATPGRTKHFQTLFLDPTLMLCDCPGLVMPSFVSTKADMVVNGILPVDQMREFVPPVTIVCKNISREILESTYGVMLPEPTEDEDQFRPPTAHELLAAYATIRGYMTHKGIPDFHRAARYILKDYVNGKLLHCLAPPGIDQASFEPKLPAIKSKRNLQETDDTECGSTSSLASSARRSTSAVNNRSTVDAAFFSQSLPRVRSHGTHGVVGFTRVMAYSGAQHSSETVATTTASQPAAAAAAGTKPWRHHNNVKKREKLRRITSHLDA